MSIKQKKVRRVWWSDLVGFARFIKWPVSLQPGPVEHFLGTIFLNDTGDPLPKKALNLQLGNFKAFDFKPSMVQATGVAAAPSRDPRMTRRLGL